jgi:hypothetical protein
LTANVVYTKVLVVICHALQANELLSTALRGMAI